MFVASLLEPVSLALLAAGVFGVMRFVWLDSRRFSDVRVGSADPAEVTRATARRLAFQAEAARAANEVESLPRAA
jgi:hypothetical protein